MECQGLGVGLTNDQLHFLASNSGTSIPYKWNYLLTSWVVAMLAFLIGRWVFKQTKGSWNVAVPYLCKTCRQDVVVLNALFRISRVDKEICAALPCTFSADTMIYFTVNMYLDIYHGILYNEYVLGYIRSILTIELRVTN